MVFFGFSGGRINLISSHNSSEIALDSWNVPDSVVSHSYEQDSL